MEREFAVVTFTNITVFKCKHKNKWNEILWNKTRENKMEYKPKQLALDFTFSASIQNGETNKKKKRLCFSPVLFSDSKVFISLKIKPTDHMTMNHFFYDDEYQTKSHFYYYFYQAATTTATTTTSTTLSK